tara:strand:+ start:5725 stop:5946 length:222 start_codon:yes stop_codon:yes gene_type:complete
MTFVEEKYEAGEIIYPVDFEEVLEELHVEDIDLDEYFEATIDLLDLETGFQVTVLLSWWLDHNLDHNFIIIND